MLTYIRLSYIISNS